MLAPIGGDQDISVLYTVIMFVYVGTVCVHACDWFDACRRRIGASGAASALARRRRYSSRVVHFRYSVYGTLCAYIVATREAFQHVYARSMDKVVLLEVVWSVCAH